MVDEPAGGVDEREESYVLRSVSVEADRRRYHADDGEKLDDEVFCRRILPEDEEGQRVNSRRRERKDGDPDLSVGAEELLVREYDRAADADEIEHAAGRRVEDEEVHRVEGRRHQLHHDQRPLLFTLIRQYVYEHRDDAYDLCEYPHTSAPSVRKVSSGVPLFSQYFILYYCLRYIVRHHVIIHIISVADVVFLASYYLKTQFFVHINRPVVFVHVQRDPPDLHLLCLRYQKTEDHFREAFASRIFFQIKFAEIKLIVPFVKREKSDVFSL